MLGCAGMADLTASLRQEFGVPVIDGVAAAVKQAESLIAQGLFHGQTRRLCEPRSQDLWRGSLAFCAPGDGGLSVADDAEIRVLDGRRGRGPCRWAALEGWNPGHGDAAAFRSADPDGFLGCFVDGRLAAGISAVRYGSSFGFIGFTSAIRNFGGRGLGGRCGRPAWHILPTGSWGSTVSWSSRQIMGGWVSSPPMTRCAGASTVWRHSAHRMPVAMRCETSIFRKSLPSIVPISPRIGRALLPPGCSLPGVRLSAGVRGRFRLCVVRPCLSGYKIGPLFAVDGRTAEDLVKICLTSVTGAEVHLDVPSYQKGFGYLLGRSVQSRL